MICRSFGTAAWMLLILVGTSSCAGSMKSEADVELCEVEEEPQQEAHAVTTADVYLDASQSMQGYISDPEHPNPVTPFQQLLQTLLVESLSAIDLSPRLYTFGRELNTEPLPLSRLGEYVTARASYHESRSDVAAALEAAAADPSKLSVIITDNAQDLEYAKEGRERRAAGFDRSAITRTVGETLAGKGFGVWLVGAQSPFEGTYYSLTLTLRPDRGASTNLPVEFKGDAERPYYERPFYCWVISRDWEKGRRLVLTLQAELARFVGHGAEGRSKVHAVEFFPGIAPALTLEEPSYQELEPPETLKAGAGSLPLRDVFRVRSWRNEPSRQGVTSAELVFETPRTSEILFLLKTRMTLPTSQEAAVLSLPLSAWEVLPQRSLDLGARLSGEVTAFSASAATRGRASGAVSYWGLSVPYESIASSPESRWVVPAHFSLHVGPLPGDYWLREWSTQNDTSVEGLAGKTIYLDDIAQAILDRTVGRERRSGCVSLRLVRE